MYKVLVLISIFLLSLIGMYVLTRFAYKIGLMDVPNERSMHKKAVPRGAGIFLFYQYF